MTVTVVDSDKFELEGVSTRTFAADSEGVVEFNVKVKPPYFVKGTDCKQSVVVQTGPGTALIRLMNVTYSTRVTLDCGVAGQTIFYDFNGGKRLDGKEKGFVEIYDLSNHLRANTYNGEGLKREGFVLTGWNEKADGSGVRTGLGSRTDARKINQVLYAEWAEEYSYFAFSYFDLADGVKITSFADKNFKGKVVLPGRIEGRPVTEIGAGAFSGCLMSGIVLPPSVKRVEKNAFQNCYFKELYLSDNLEEISDDSFFNCPQFETLHISAAEPPRYIAYDRHAAFADKFDILIQNADKKKIVVFGGSGAYFSVDTLRMEARLKDYVVINMALNAYYSAQAQLDMIIPYLKEGDVFLHLPESAGEYQTMQKNDIADTRLFMSLEANYDLTGRIDLKALSGVLNVFNTFNKDRAGLVPVSYGDYADFIDSRGNYNQPKPSFGQDAPISEEANIRFDYLSNTAAIHELKSYYDKIIQKGARVFMGNAAINRQGLELHFDDPDAQAENYDRVFRKVFNDYPIVLDLKDCLYDGSQFFNSDFHLCAQTTELHTDKIIERLQALL